MDPKATAKKKNPPHPRFFERATPNQMWQTDIFTFRLAGKYAYIVAFMDDYSRFIVGLDLFRSPTAEAVIETYRVAAGEYQPPKEMLTDHGRQYTNWRGQSRFAKELEKDRIKHIVSRPQHPMTLGKVERFWETIWNEFLVRAQFGSFDEARDRIRWWVKYYNHKRPHQGIEGLCPADRYFEIAHELKKTIETGVAENILEMALRGEPREPFYMVGRMEGQSVVLQAEKGQLRLSVENKTEKELIYDIGKEGKSETQKDAQSGASHRSGGESEGGIGRLDGEMSSRGCVQSTGDTMGDLCPVAGACDGRNAASTGATGELGTGQCPESPSPATFGETAAGNERREANPAVDSAPVAEESNRGGEAINEPGESEAEGGSDPSCESRGDHRQSGSRDIGHIPQDLLRVGEKGTARDDGSAPGPVAGTAPADGRSSESRHGERERIAQGEDGGTRTSCGNPGCDEESRCIADR